MNILFFCGNKFYKSDFINKELRNLEEILAFCKDKFYKTP